MLLLMLQNKEPRFASHYQDPRDLVDYCEKSFEYFTVWIGNDAKGQQVVKPLTEVEELKGFVESALNLLDELIYDPALRQYNDQAQQAIVDFYATLLLGHVAEYQQDLPMTLEDMYELHQQPLDLPGRERIFELMHLLFSKPRTNREAPKQLNERVDEAIAFLREPDDSTLNLEIPEKLELVTRQILGEMIDERASTYAMLSESSLLSLVVDLLLEATAHEGSAREFYHDFSKQSEYQQQKLANLKHIEAIQRRIAGMPENPDSQEHTEAQAHEEDHSAPEEIGLDDIDEDVVALVEQKIHLLCDREYTCGFKKDKPLVVPGEEFASSIREGGILVLTLAQSHELKAEDNEAVLNYLMEEVASMITHVARESQNNGDTMEQTHERVAKHFQGQPSPALTALQAKLAINLPLNIDIGFTDEGPANISDKATNDVRIESIAETCKACLKDYKQAMYPDRPLDELELVKRREILDRAAAALTGKDINTAVWLNEYAHPARALSMFAIAELVLDPDSPMGALSELVDTKLEYLKRIVSLRHEEFHSMANENGIENTRTLCGMIDHEWMERIENDLREAYIETHVVHRDPEEWMHGKTPYIRNLPEGSGLIDLINQGITYLYNNNCGLLPLPVENEEIEEATARFRTLVADTGKSYFQLASSHGLTIPAHVEILNTMLNAMDQAFDSIIRQETMRSNDIDATLERLTTFATGEHPPMYSMLEMVMRLKEAALLPIDMTLSSKPDLSDTHATNERIAIMLRETTARMTEVMQALDPQHSYSEAAIQARKEWLAEMAEHFKGERAESREMMQNTPHKIRMKTFSDLCLTTCNSHYALDQIQQSLSVSNGTLAEIMKQRTAEYTPHTQVSSADRCGMVTFWPSRDADNQPIARNTGVVRH